MLASGFGRIGADLWYQWLGYRYRWVQSDAEAAAAGLAAIAGAVDPSGGKHAGGRPHWGGHEFV